MTTTSTAPPGPVNEKSPVDRPGSKGSGQNSKSWTTCSANGNTARGISAVIASSSAEMHRLLVRLEGVRRSGRGWIARCPAHEDRAASLSIGEGRNGGILLHCFAGCDASAICFAIGMSVSDLFPSRPIRPEAFDRHADRQARAEALTDRARWSVASILPELEHEALVLRVAAADLLRGRALTSVDLERLLVAETRIGAALDVLRPKVREVCP